MRGDGDMTQRIPQRRHLEDDGKYSDYDIVYMVDYDAIYAGNPPGWMIEAGEDKRTAMFRMTTDPGFDVCGFEVSVDIEHVDPEDLSVSLTGSLDGTVESFEIVLFEANEDCRDGNHIVTTFNDAGTDSICQEGNHVKPVGSLDSLLNLFTGPAKWSLRLDNSNSIEDMYLHEWKILLTECDDDGDRVGNSNDLCPDTGVFTHTEEVFLDRTFTVDESGCSLDQYCPCRQEYTDVKEYSNCVKTTSNEFRKKGLVSENKRFYKNRVKDAQAIFGCGTDINKCPNTGSCQATNTCIDSTISEDAEGCSLDDYCPCENGWRNKKKYKRCIQRTAKKLIKQGVLSEDADFYVATAELSSCGEA